LCFTFVEPNDRWRKKYDGLLPSVARRLKQLKERQAEADGRGYSIDKVMLAQTCL